MVSAPPPPLRLTIDLDALAANWRWFAARSGAADCGAAVKADGYGLGAVEVVRRLAGAGCRTFFVSTAAEAAKLLPLAEGLSLRVLHGVTEADLAFVRDAGLIPVLNTAEQIALWRAAGGGRCDLMVDTGMNRLGIALVELGLAGGLAVETLHSHLACADTPDHPLNARQLAAFRALDLPGVRRSLANSAGICLGSDWHFDLTRPGLGLYGGIPHPAAAAYVRQVARVEARIVQVRDVKPGDGVGYGADFVAARPTRVAILNIGYADGYLRAFSDGAGEALAGDHRCPVLGRVSMDLTAVDVTGASVAEGDWLTVDVDPATASVRSGLSQYELLTGLGSRYQRIYT